jgi:hypothetical protein
MFISVDYTENALGKRQKFPLNIKGGYRLAENPGFCDKPVQL